LRKQRKLGIEAKEKLNEVLQAVIFNKRIGEKEKDDIEDLLDEKCFNVEEEQRICEELQEKRSHLEK
jgi:hypothetical protein